MKALLLAEDLKDKTPSDQNRARLSKAWAKYFSEHLAAALQSATVLDTEEAVFESLLIDTPLKKLVETYASHRSTPGDIEKRLYVAGSPVNQLTKLANGHKYGMLVLGTHGHRGPKRLFLGSVAEEVIRHSEIPVCVIGPESQKLGTFPPRSGKLNIVVATDLGKGSRGAELFAIKLAKKTEGSITLAHCPYQGQDPLVSLALNTPEGAKAVEDLFVGLNKSARRALAKKQRQILSEGIECKVFLDTRSVFSFRSILKAVSREKANLVVTGTHGRTLLGKAFFGSTTRQTILNSPVPLITVRK